MSNDNPFSEAVNIADARIFCDAFFEHYNHHHRRSGIGLHTPASVHYGTAAEIRAHRTETLGAAYNVNPCRLGNRRPSPPPLPTAAWINKPTIANDAQKNPEYLSQRP